MQEGHGSRRHPFSGPGCRGPPRPRPHPSPSSCPPPPQESGPLHSLPAMLSRHELSSPATGHSLWMLMLSSPRWPPRWPMGISVHPVPPSPVGCPCPAGLGPTTLAPAHSTNCEEGLPAPPRPKPSLLLPQSLAAPQVRPLPRHTHRDSVCLGSASGPTRSHSRRCIGTCELWGSRGQGASGCLLCIRPSQATSGTRERAGWNVPGSASCRQGRRQRTDTPGHEPT